MSSIVHEFSFMTEKQKFLIWNESCFCCFLSQALKQNFKVFSHSHPLRHVHHNVCYSIFPMSLRKSTIWITIFMQKGSRCPCVWQCFCSCLSQWGSSGHAYLLFACMHIEMHLSKHMSVCPYMLLAFPLRWTVRRWLTSEMRCCRSPCL